MRWHRAALGWTAGSVGFIKINPALKVKIPKYDAPQTDPAHIFTPEEIELIFNRFRNSHTIYYAFLTAYYTGLRISESKKNQPDPDADYHDEDEDALQLPEDDGDEDEEVDVNEDYEAESDDEPV